MTRQIDKLRNIGIIAHIDAGKTTMTERMLFLAGSKHRVGMVDKGTTTTDDDPEEQDRGITIYSACVTFPWNDTIVNLLDTPGHVDFTAEVERCLRVLDGAVVVFSAREGVEAQSETVWRQANKYDVSRIAFINKLDREGADFESVVGEIESRLSGVPVPISIPVGQGPAHVADPFRAIIDLVEMKMLTFDPESDGRKFTVDEIPEEHRENAELWRTQMIDNLSKFSDELIEQVLSEQEPSPELIHSVIRDATIEHQIQPVLCGSALHGIGVQTVLDAVERYLPNPQEMPPVEGFNPNKPTLKESRKPDSDEALCGLVFKILPAKTADLYWMRVYSGKLKANTRVYCPSKDKKENVAQLWQIHATKRDRDGQVDEIGAGDIVGVIGPRFAVTGDTICDSKKLIQLESIEFPETVIEMAIEPESTAERAKLADTLEMLKRQDPTFRAFESPDTGQTLISGMGELHLEVIKHRLERDFNLNVKVHKPRVSYRETIERAAEVTGECHRVVSGKQLFAKLTVKVEPDDSVESGVKVVNFAAGAGVEPEWLEAAKEELRACGEGGGLINSFPLSKLKITMTAAEGTVDGSNEMAFSIAASEAFKEAMDQAGPIVLEPIMKLSINTPDEYYGDFVNDLTQRRAQIVRTESRTGRTILEAHAPLAELFGFANSMRSLSQGKASSSMEPYQYAPAPADVANSFAF